MGRPQGCMCERAGHGLCIDISEVCMGRYKNLGRPSIFLHCGAIESANDADKIQNVTKKKDSKVENYHAPRSWGIDGGADPVSIILINHWFTLKGRKRNISATCDCVSSNRRFLSTCKVFALWSCVKTISLPLEKVAKTGICLSLDTFLLEKEFPLFQCIDGQRKYFFRRRKNNANMCTQRHH